MAILEQNVLLVGKAGSNQTLNYPITRLCNVNDTAEVKPNLETGDFIPVFDATTGETKKAPFPTAFPPAPHKSTHTTGGSDAITPVDIGAAPDSHSHDDLYYTEDEIDTKLAEKVPLSFIKVTGESNALASGKGSIAVGDATTSGNCSIAMGCESIAQGGYSTALGYRVTANANGSTALGYDTNAKGYGSTALGYQANAKGRYSIALGTALIASGDNSTALGGYANATGYASTALGYQVNANKSGSSALGYAATANGNYSLALGYAATASGDDSTALGRGSSAKGYGSTALGCLSSAGGSNSIALGASAKASGTYSIAFGEIANVSGYGSTAIGYRAATANVNSIQLGDASNLSSITAKVAVTVTSDERDKTDISPVESKAVEFLRKVQAIRYVWNGRSMYIPDEASRSETDKENLSKFGLCEYDCEAHAKGSPKALRKENVSELVFLRRTFKRL